MEDSKFCVVSSSLCPRRDENLRDVELVETDDFAPTVSQVLQMICDFVVAPVLTSLTVVYALRQNERE